MGNALVKSQTEQAEVFLTEAARNFNQFLNEATISGLIKEAEGEAEYYEALMSGIRRLSVYSEEALDACRVILSGVQFSKPAAERILYKIYHQCIEEFFSPKHDLWFENSRSAYTGNHSIKFRQAVPPSVTELFRSLEGKFQQVREELEFYETDYMTKIIQSQ